MPYTVATLANELMGEIPRMSRPAAISIVKRVWDVLKNHRGWNFLQKEGVIAVGAQVSTGAVAVTKGSNAITFDATALAALNATVSLDTAIVGRQFRTGTTGQVYTIETYDSGTGEATLNRVWVEDTDAALSAWRVNRAYFTPPGGKDFKRFQSIIDPDNAYPITWHWTKEQLDRSDPQRQAFGNPYRVALVDRDDPTTPGAPRYELWPHPVSERVYVVQYQAKGDVDHLGNDINVRAQETAFTFPENFSDTVLRTGAFYQGYVWAESHKGEFEELRSTSWRFQKRDMLAEYGRALVEAKKIDDELGLATKLMPPDQYPGAPIDASYAQRHDVDWLS